MLLIRAGLRRGRKAVSLINLIFMAKNCFKFCSNGGNIGLCGIFIELSRKGCLAQTGMKQHFPALGRQAATRQTYTTTGTALANRLAKKAGSSDPAELVAGFISSGRGLAQRTFRLYKASLLQHLGDQQVAPSVLFKLKNASSKGCPKTSNKTSGRKAKTIPPDDQTLLLLMLRTRSSKTAAIAADYFQAGLIAGPRPIEWIGAKLSVVGKQLLDTPSTSTHTLTFLNAKRDEFEIRGNGTTRTVYLTLTATDAAVITRVIADADYNAMDWARHYGQLRGVLRYAAKKLWPKRKKLPGFYTTRHQSQADAKASGKRPNEIAAMYGHASDNTATQHYARASQGDKNMYKISPTALSLANVRNQKTTARLAAREQGIDPVLSKKEKTE